MSTIGGCNAFRYEPIKREPEFVKNLKAVKITEAEFAV